MSGFIAWLKVLFGVINKSLDAWRTKQDRDAGRAEANEDAIKEREKRRKQADKIKHDSSKRTDDFEL